jgi:hypothetical protein
MNSSNPLTDSGKVALAEYLLLDANMALLFVQRASQTSDPKLQERRLKAAAKAYDRIIAFIPRVSLTPAQMLLLEQRLSRLRSLLKMRPSEVAH